MRAFVYRTLLRLTIGSAYLAILLAGFYAGGARGEEPDEKRGYWWYVEPPQEEEEPIGPQAPEIPPLERLEAMAPKEIGALMEAQLDYALVVQSVEAVEDYYRLVDLVRRRSRGFAALASVAMLQNPDLNARSAYPTTNPGREELTRRREQERDLRLARERQSFALLMFSSENCTFCVSQWGVLQYFADRTGWIVRKIDVQREPAKAARFNVTGTPVTVLIERDTENWFPVAVGSESFPAVADNAYRAVRFLRGEITETQFFNGAGDDGGFFDPEAARNE